MANVQHRNLVQCYPFEVQVKKNETERLSSSNNFIYSAELNPTNDDDHPPPSHRKGKPSPPISYPKEHNTPRPTTFVIKQLIGDGATLVYDSLTQNNTPSLLQHHFYPNHHFQQQRKEHVRIQQTHLTNSNPPSKPKTVHTKTRNASVS